MTTLRRSAVGPWGAIALVVAMGVAFGAGPVPAALAHGDADELYEVVIRKVTPTLPIEVEIEDGDRIRFENRGDEELLICGYTDACDYVRIGPEGVFVNEDSEAYFANQDEDDPAPIPDGAGEGPPKWELVREEPPFFAYHDHRLHWMSDDVPGTVDQSRPGRQELYDWTIDVRYGSTEGEVHGTLYYVGGQSFLSRWGELLLTGAGVLAMLVVFAVDARRRRRARAAAAAGAAPVADGAEPPTRAHPEPTADD